MPTAQRVFNLPKSSWKAWGAEKHPETCPSTCAESLNYGALPAPTSEPSLGAQDQQHQLGGQNHISETPISCMVSPQYPGEKPLGAPTSAHRMPAPALLGMML